MIINERNVALILEILKKYNRRIVVINHVQIQRMSTYIENLLRALANTLQELDNSGQKFMELLSVLMFTVEIDGKTYETDSSTPK